MDLYTARNIFGLTSSYTKEDVNETYRKLMKIWHPDINKSGEAEEKSKQINEAKDVLIKALNEYKGEYAHVKTGYDGNNDIGRITRYVELLKKCIGSYTESELTPFLMKIINIANSLINEFSKINVPSSYIYDLYMRKLYNLFIEYANMFGKYYKLNVDWDSDAVFINNICIMYKNKTLMEFVREINNKTYNKIYLDFYARLEKFIRSNKIINELLEDKNFCQSYDKKFMLLCMTISLKLTDFELVFKNNHHNNSNVKDLTSAFNDIHSFICSEILKYINNYCKNNKLQYTYDSARNICIINGIEVSIDGNVFAIYNTLVSIKKLSKLNSKTTVRKDDNEFVLHLK